MEIGTLKGAGLGPAPFCFSTEPPALDHFVVRIDPDRVFFLKFILEGYDNLFITTTLNCRYGVVLIRAVSGAGSELEAIIDSIREEIGFICLEQA